MPETTPRRRWKGLRPDLDRDARRYYVYRLFDAAGKLLYIGRSCDPLSRLKGHHATLARSHLVVAWPGRRCSSLPPDPWRP